jgi:hypothetical protein
VATIRVRVSGQEKLGRLSRRLRDAAGGGLDRDVTDELRRAAPPVLSRTRRAVLAASFPAATPSRRPSRRSTGLRSRLAAATGTIPLSSPPGVRFQVEGSGVLPGDGRGGHKLARYTDTELAPRWRHQVFGREENPSDWFNQRGQPWFFVSIRGEEPRFARAVFAAMDKTARRIMG